MLEKWNNRIIYLSWLVLFICDFQTIYSRSFLFLPKLEDKITNSYIYELNQKPLLGIDQFNRFEKEELLLFLLQWDISSNNNFSNYQLNSGDFIKNLNGFKYNHLESTDFYFGDSNSLYYTDTFLTNANNSDIAKSFHWTHFNDLTNQQTNSLFYSDLLLSSKLLYRRDIKKLLSDIREQRLKKVKLEQKNEALLLSINNRNISSQISLQGFQEVRLSYGTSRHFLYKKKPSSGYKLNRDYFNFFSPNLPSNPFYSGYPGANNVISDGFLFDQRLSITANGKIGNRVEIEVDYDSEARENNFSIQYLGHKREFVSRIRFGKVKLNLGGKSRFVVSGGGTKEVNGIRLEGSKGGFELKSVLGITRGVSDVFRLEGGTRNIRDIDYFKNRFFQLPDENVDTVEHVLYREVLTEQESQNASFTLTNTDSGGNEEIYSLELVNKVDYEVELIDSRIRVDLGNKNYTGNVFFFYQVRKEGRTSFVPGEATNVLSLIGNNITYESNQISLEDHRVALLSVRDSELTEENLDQYYELRNHYSIPRDISVDQFELSIIDATGRLIDNNIWIGDINHLFEKSGEAVLDINNGLFYFTSRNPLTNYSTYGDVNERGIYDVEIPSSEFNTINFRLNIDSNTITTFSVGRFNLVPGSVVVIRNGRTLDKSEYRVNYLSGRISFNENQILLKGEQLEVHYEYQPFGNSLQKIILANRLDYNFFGNSSIGSTFSYSIAQNFVGSPTLGQEAGQNFVMNLNTHLELVSLFSKRRYSDYFINLDGEYAFSVIDKNLKNVAILDDFESLNNTFSLSSSFVNYYQTANPSLDTKSSGERVLGRSFFVDFSRYTLTGSRQSVAFTLEDEKNMNNNTSGNALFRRQNVNFRPYSIKSGPFQVVGETHLNRSEYPQLSSLVFDFDFDLSAGLPEGAEPIVNQSYLSYIVPTSFNQSVNFANYKQLEIIYKLLPSYDVQTDSITSDPGVIGISIDAGQLNEDIDLDGIRDEEKFSSDVRGFEFNYTNEEYQNNTQIGGGFLGFDNPESISVGNNIRDLENRNQDSIFITSATEDMIRYPSSQTVTDNDDASTFFPVYSENYINTNTLAKSIVNGEQRTNNALYEVLDNFSHAPSDPYQSGNYYKMTIPLKRLITNSTLENVTHLRLNLLELNENINERDRGRLIIESVKFVGDVWNQVRIDNNLVQQSLQFLASSIGTRNDDEYFQNHIARYYRSEYEILHGTLLNRDIETINENALLLNFNLNGVTNEDINDSVNGRLALVEKHDASTNNADFAFYNALRFYLFARTLQGKENGDLIYRFGRDVNNYYEIRIPMQTILDDRRWYEYTIRFRPNDILKQDEFDRNYTDDTSHIFELQRRSVTDNRARRNISINKRRNTTVEKNEYTARRIGRPSLSQVFYHAFGVENHSDTAEILKGNIIIDEIIVADDKPRFGHAYYMGIDFGKVKPLNYKGIPILSEISNKLSYSYEGVGFGAIDIEPSKNHKENTFINNHFKLLDTFTWNYDFNQFYQLSDFRQDINPTELQSININRSQKIDMKIAIPGLMGKFIPDFFSSIQIGQESKLDFKDTNTVSLDTEDTENTDIDNASINAFQNVNLTHGYLLGINKKYQFTQKIALSHKSTISTSYQRRDLLEENHLIDDLDLSTYNGYGFFSRLSQNAQRKVNPVLNLFPKWQDSIREKKEQLQEVNYGFNRQYLWEESLELYHFRWSFFYQEDINYSLDINSFDETQNDLINTASRYFDYNGGADAFTFPLVNNFDKVRENAQFNLVNYEYRTTFGYQSDFKIGTLQINRISINFNYTYREDSFRYRETNEIDTGRLQILLNNNDLVESISNFYRVGRDFKDTQATLSWAVNIPIRFLDYKKRRNNSLFSDVSQLFFSRTVSRRDNRVLNEPLSKNITSQIDNDFIGINGAGQRTGFDRKTSNLQREYLSSLAPILLSDWERDRNFLDNLGGLIPYYNFLFLDDLAYYLYRALFKGRFVRLNRNEYRELWRYKDRYRIRIAENIDKHLDEFDRKIDINDSVSINKITAHSEFATRVEQQDSFRFRFNIRRYRNFLQYLLPNYIQYGGTLFTIKDDGNLEQREDVIIDVSKDFKKLNNIITSKLPHGDNFFRRLSFNSHYQYRLNRNFNLKTRTITQTFNLGFTMVNVVDKVNLSFNYNGEYSSAFQSLRFQHYPNQSLKNRPYLGIGKPIDHIVESDFDGDEIEYLNVGTLESFKFINHVTELAEESADLIKLQNDFVLRLTWFSRSPNKQIRIGKKKKLITLPNLRQQVVTWFFSFINYNQPFVTRNALNNGQLLADDFDNVIAYKNVNQFTTIFPENRDIPLWFTSLTYNGSIQFDKRNTFTIEYDVTLALVGVARARNPSALKKISTDDVVFRRERDFVQFGLNLELKSVLRF